MRVHLFYSHGVNTQRAPCAVRSYNNRQCRGKGTALFVTTAAYKHIRDVQMHDRYVTPPPPTQVDPNLNEALYLNTVSLAPSPHTMILYKEYYARSAIYTVLLLCHTFTMLRTVFSELCPYLTPAGKYRTQVHLNCTSEGTKKKRKEKGFRPVH